MNINRDPEVVMAAWLDDGPAQLPTDTRQAIAVGIRTVPRRRPGISWPFGRARLGQPNGGLGQVALMLSGAVVLVLAAVVALSYYANQNGFGAPVAPTAQPSTFAGNWEATDPPPDSSHLTMVVVAQPDGTYEVTILDDLASRCDGVSSTMTGVGEKTAPGTYVIAHPEYVCDDGSDPVALSGPPLEEGLRNLTFTHHADRDVLEDSVDHLEWSRINASPPLSPASPIPSLETTPSASPTDPSTSLPSPRPSPAVGSSRFTSSINGISIDYPSGWQIREATEPWNHDAVAFGSPDVDVIFDPTLQDELYIGLVSEPLGGKSADEWCCGPVVAATEICIGPNGYLGGAFGRWTVDGVRGWIQSCGVGNHLVAVTTATRGYVIYLHVADERIFEPTYGDPGDWFEAFLETVDLP